MKNLTTLSFGIVAIGAALGFASAVKAQDAPPAPPAATGDGAMGGHMPDMMGRMNRMMDQCDRMMRSKEKNRGSHG
jgi:deoxyxylulose-5-phosphate synthase